MSGMVYIFHQTLDLKSIAILLFFMATTFSALDYSRRHLYLIGLGLYPLIGIVGTLIQHESLFPIVIFIELSMFIFIWFGIRLGGKISHWLESNET